MVLQPIDCAGQLVDGPAQRGAGGKQPSDPVHGLVAAQEHHARRHHAHDDGRQEDSGLQVAPGHLPALDFGDPETLEASPSLRERRALKTIEVIAEVRNALLKEMGIATPTLSNIRRA